MCMKNNPGSVFDVYLPASVHSAEQFSGKFAALPLLQGAGESIMVIDDEAVPRQVTGSMLRSLGYQVSEAESGETAVAMLGHRKVDLLLLDMVMDPGIGGLETCRRILKLHPKQKALIMSGQAEKDDVDEAQRLGVMNFLMKPLGLQQLAAEVHAELKR